jgi:hypothetical protein
MISFGRGGRVVEGNRILLAEMRVHWQPCRGFESFPSPPIPDCPVPGDPARYGWSLTSLATRRALPAPLVEFVNAISAGYATLVH